MSLDNSLRIRLDVWGDRGGEMMAGQGLQQRRSHHGQWLAKLRPNPGTKGKGYWVV